MTELTSFTGKGFIYKEIYSHSLAISIIGIYVDWQQINVSGEL